MKIRMFMILAVVLSILLPSCGKKSSKEKPKKAAVGEKHLKMGNSTKQLFEQGGFRVVFFGKFPSEEQGVKGRVAVYRKEGDSEGGVIYFKKIKNEVLPAWHWYFTDFAPDSVNKTELNNDGLWDVRVFAGHKKIDFIQDDSFTLMAKPRSDWLAMNCKSSAPVDSLHEVWKCFDGDSSTTWRAPLDQKHEAYIELIAPFGIQEGMLTIRLASEEQPKSCDVYMGDKKIDGFKLKANDRKQLMHISNKAQGAKRIKIVFKSTNEKSGRFISVAELSLK